MYCQRMDSYQSEGTRNITLLIIDHLKRGFFFFNGDWGVVILKNVSNQGCFCCNNV